jgi:hypothetical protein
MTTELRAELCHTIFPRESEIEETVTEELGVYVSTDRTTTSLALAVVTPEIEKVEPDVQVPVALPSRAGAGGSAKSWNESAPAGIEVAEAN